MTERSKSLGEAAAVYPHEQMRDMAQTNPTRVHLVDKLEKLVDEYNLGTLDTEAFFAALKKLIAEMDEEERRAAKRG